MTDYRLSDGRPNGNVAGGPDLRGFVVKLETYQDGEGRIVQGREVVLGTPPGEFHRFIGIAKVAIQIQTPHGPIVKEDSLRFAIPGAKTVAEAFGAYEGFMTREQAVYTQKVDAEIRAANTPQLAVATAESLKHLPRPPSHARG